MPENPADQRAVWVADYDPGWPDRFLRIRDRVWPAVSAIATGIEHVGSTAVPGLAAKPVIDLDVVIRSRGDLPAAQAALAGIGYEFQGDLGIADRTAFRAPPGSVAHHLYVCVQGSAALGNHLAVRDQLRADPRAAAEYSALKRRLADQFPQDVGRYTEAKSEFLLSLLSRRGFSAEVRESIRRANRADGG